MTMDERNRIQRSVVLYVTIDPYDHRDENGTLRGHGSNLARVREAAASWRSGTPVLDRWCGHVTSESLKDPALLALFLSGSYTEWVESFRQPAWKGLLDRFCGVIRETNVPILAVCGSHQLVAYAYGGWQSVGHMAPAATMPVAIADETDGTFRAPNPRVGEVGTFRYRIEGQDLAQRRKEDLTQRHEGTKPQCRNEGLYETQNLLQTKGFAEIAYAKRIREVGTLPYRTVSTDPLFEGLTVGPDRPLIFSQWHYDEVVRSAVPGCATSLLRPDGLNGSVQNRDLDQLRSVVVTPGAKGSAFTHRSIADASECCQIQALRYDVPPAGRILYSTQFHPDLPGTDSHGNGDHGLALIHRFLQLSDEYWKAHRL